MPHRIVSSSRLIAPRHLDNWTLITQTYSVKAAQHMRYRKARWPIAAKQHQLAEFFWWTAWAASTNRPGPRSHTQTTGLTNRWLRMLPLPAPSLWSDLELRRLARRHRWIIWWYASQEKELVHGPYPEQDPFLGSQPTPSQRATMKYFFVVVALWVRADPDGRHHRALRRRRSRLLRLPTRQVSALCGHANMAFADRHFLDRDFVAGDGSLRWPRSQRSRTEVSSGSA